VVVTDLHIHDAEELLFAATYGRAAYKADISNDLVSSTFDDPIEDLTIYPNPASEILNVTLTESFNKANIIFYDSLDE